jgi:hypothetical protein
MKRKLGLNGLTAYLLAAIIALAFILSFFDIVPGGPLGIASTTAILLIFCVLTNWGISRMRGMRVKSESSVVTALILALICGPVSVLESPLQILVLALCGAAGIAAKHLLSWRRRPVFNPAALGAFLAGLIFGSYATWWVGNIALLPLVAAGGLFISYRVKRLRFIGVFFAVFVALMAATGLLQGMGLEEIAQMAVFVFSRTALVFFVTFMVTEPKTAPKSFPLQIPFLVIVAFFYQPGIALFAFSPEAALLVGNLFAFGAALLKRNALPQPSRSLSP